MSIATAAATTLSACRGASVTYGGGEAKVRALVEVDLSIAPGESIALWGPSGSGKTTLLHLLGGLLVPSTGEVLWKGEALSSLDAAARSKTRAGGIAYVLQGSNLLPTFNAYENVAFAAWVAARAGLDARHAPAELLGLVGLSGKAAALPVELSGGEAQRVALARALASSPELLLCDEPTGHLDSDTAGRVLDLLEALQKRFGFSLALATHDRCVAARWARQVRLADGRIVGAERT
jgi:putative ABC transport system ATP-binding protein